MKSLFEHSINTHKRAEFVNITREVIESIAASGVREGICVVWVPHTTAGVTVNENADPDVTADMTRHLSKMIPQNAGFDHAEGNSDSHIKTTLTGASLTLIVHEGRPLLGTWQGIYFAEYDGPRHRKFFVKCVEG